MKKPDADYEIGGYWGNHIHWFTDGDDWKKINDKDFLPKAYGHIQPSEQPVAGSTIVSEFKKSWRVFRVVKVRQERNPKDMFWADCELIDVVKKEG